MTLLLAAGLLLSVPALATDQVPDPTRPSWPPRAGTHNGPHFVVTSILVGADGRRVAIINGMPLNQGDSLRGARVLRIGPETVVLRAAGKTMTLTLLRDGVEKISR